ncbi:MAG: NAD(P)/FAD-dependent oxidoreductase [Christensenellaceae bacterium]|jgi:predicted Rossmann fold flavoprotein|nr:NAD(P)/FAD-dependent oxidoreductase [Christensenellaceae bacterium]
MRIAIIGGGAAGMMAGIQAAEGGAAVTLFEGNEKLGKKVYITGKGRCNLTNAKTYDEFFKGLAHNGRFMYSAMHFFSNLRMMDLIEGLGVPLNVERGERVFPASNKASDVSRALEGRLRALGVEIRLNARVEAVKTAPNGFLVRASGREEPFSRVILCTGGLSYPATGSDGFGLALAQALGHEVTDLQPSLIPILTREDWPKALSGLSLKNVEFSARRGKKLLFKELGEMLFTHFGLSGPLVLSASAHLVGLPLDEILLLIDLKPGLSHEQLDARLLRELTAEPRKQMAGLMAALAPKSLGLALLELAGIPEGTVASQLTRSQRGDLAGILKALPLHAAGFRPIEEAIITRGGLNIKQIDPSTMQSKLLPGLYLAGEMLDVDGYTGGFNLQIAWSTGALAGHSAAAGA